jgi:hypothetical protein
LSSLCNRNTFGLNSPRKIFLPPAKPANPQTYTNCSISKKRSWVASRFAESTDFQFVQFLKGATVKKIILSLLFALSALPFAQAQAAEVQTLSFQQLQAQMRSNIKQDVVIEFYNSKSDGLDCDRCADQESVLAAAASHYGSDVSFVRVDVSTAPQLIDMGIVGIYPTHLFVRHNVPEGQEMVARRIRGFISEDDFKSLISEFFGINQQ